jgi:crossover junction endodeoxyribonuclease RuvC
MSLKSSKSKVKTSLRSKDVIGLDMSLVHTGWAHRTEYDSISSSVIKPKNLRGVERLHYIADQVEFLLGGRTESDTLIVIEGYSFGSRGRSTVSLGELGGITRLCLHKLGFKYLEVAPKQLKKFITGNGNASKEEMIKEVNSKMGLELTDDNEADAVALTMLGKAYLSDGKGLTSDQKEIIYNLKQANK